MFPISSPTVSKSRSVLLSGLVVLSAGSSPSEGLVLLVGEVSPVRPLASDCSWSCGAGVTDRGRREEKER